MRMIKIVISKYHKTITTIQFMWDKGACRIKEGSWSNYCKNHNLNLQTKSESKQSQPPFKARLVTP